MSEPTYHKTVCKECGGSVEFPEESEGATTACPHCGKDLFLYRAVRAVGTPPVKQNDFTPNPPASTPVLWNPTAAVNWSLLFSPAFGAYIHAQNADSLGRTEEAKINRGWFYASIIYLIIALVSCFIPAIPDVIFKFGGLALLGGWYSSIGGKQVKFVKATWQKNYKKKSWKIPLSVAFGCLIVSIAVLVIAFSILPDGSQSTQTQPAPQQTQIAQTPQQQTAATPDAPAPSQPQPEAVQTDWNKNENDAMKNGNIAFAIQTILANPNLRSQARIQDPQMVAKTPWNYYGQVVKLSGQVAVVQDFTAGSDNGQAFGGKDGCQIVMGTEGGTIVEIYCMKPSGNMRVGDNVNLYGYPAGVTDVPNRLGGNDVHLILVGNDYDNLGVAQ